jgi:hypothetical protein
MALKQMNLKVEEEDLKLWKHGAEIAGITLSEWIRRKCSGESIRERSDSQNVQRVPDVPLAGRSYPTPGGFCLHDYGPKACPFPGCENYKWRDE